MLLAYQVLHKHGQPLGHGGDGPEGDGILRGWRHKREEAAQAAEPEAFWRIDTHFLAAQLDIKSRITEYGFCRLLVKASIACVSASIPHVAVGY